ncbi:LytTR family DNA-binding domain-containing protein [Paenibacillus sp. FSL K6-1217]|uniref:LytTR family DNA-binding domain-containing protein n=1 Tax=Paenibacillus sp. FSL K6-1217 TaxID=2921466 RepID=UPI003253A44D
MKTGLQMHIIHPRDVYYFEAVDHKVFIYCREKVYESRQGLCELEMEYESGDFFRASKSSILNVAQIQSLLLHPRRCAGDPLAVAVH